MKMFLPGKIGCFENMAYQKSSEKDEIFTNLKPKFRFNIIENVIVANSRQMRNRNDTDSNFGIQEKFVKDPIVLNIHTDSSDKSLRKSYCRLCASIVPASCLTPLSDSKDGISFIDKIMFCFSEKVQVHKHDGLPQEICNSCIVQLNACHNILETLIKANLKLQKLFKPKRLPVVEVMDNYPVKHIELNLPVKKMRLSNLSVTQRVSNSSQIQETNPTVKQIKTILPAIEIDPIPLVNEIEPYQFVKETENSSPVQDIEPSLPVQDIERKASMNVEPAPLKLSTQPGCGTKTSNILDRKLGVYSDIDDDHNDLNNYAKSLEAYTNRKTCNLSPTHRNNILTSEIIEPKPIFAKPNARQANKTPQFSKPGPKTNAYSGFKTARDVLHEQNLQKHGSRSSDDKQDMQLEARKKCLGTRRGIRSKFIPPSRNYEDDDGALQFPKETASDWNGDDVIDEKLKNIEPRMVELIKSEIMNSTANISWNDIAGLEFAKMVIKEDVVLPMLRPDIFTGLRRPPKGILLFGPPGTGKTRIGKCIASQSNSTFFSISASSLTSKWIGDGEKMVRAMFAVARTYQPAVIFIDEIDSLLSQRNETEHESTRTLKTEFLVQLDGAATASEDRILVIGATNRPKELDEAARRRFVIYIPLPDNLARLEIIKNLMKSEKHELIEENIVKIAALSDGYSGADMMNLCSEASLGPIRAIDIDQIQSIDAENVRLISMRDFEVALERVRATVSPADLNHYVEWNQTYGTGNY